MLVAALCSGLSNEIVKELLDAISLSADCSLDQFRCNTGGCVPKTQVCDTVEHCPDMSDEWGCVRLRDDTMNLEIRYRMLLGRHFDTVSSV
jgi:hypothetical protein